MPEAALLAGARGRIGSRAGASAQAVMERGREDGVLARQFPVAWRSAAMASWWIMRTGSRCAARARKVRQHLFDSSDQVGFLPRKFGQVPLDMIQPLNP